MEGGEGRRKERGGGGKEGKRKHLHLQFASLVFTSIICFHFHNLLELFTLWSTQAMLFKNYIFNKLLDWLPQTLLQEKLELQPCAFQRNSGK